MRPRCSCVEALLVMVACSWMQACGASCSGNNGVPDAGVDRCVNPDDPCPNDMVSSDGGCVWDRCAGEFTGTLIDHFCALSKQGVWVGDMEMLEDGVTIAYTRRLESEPVYHSGPIWLYNFVTGEERQLVEDSRKCRMLRTSGRRLAWLEIVKEFPGDPYKRPVSRITIKDVDSGVEWAVTNSEQNTLFVFSFSGDTIVFSKPREFFCSLDPITVYDLWGFDLLTQEQKLLVTTEPPRCLQAICLAAGSVVYWKYPCACTASGATASSQHWILDLQTGAQRLIDEFSSGDTPLGGAEEDQTLRFDGIWEVAWMGTSIKAWNVFTGESFEVTRCSKGDCWCELGNGIAVYNRYGEDGLTQYQIYAMDLATRQVQKLTHLRPYYDSAFPLEMVGNRLLWAENRGESIRDPCGKYHEATGATGLMFWKDLEF